MTSPRAPSVWATFGLLCILPLATLALHRFGLRRCHGWMLRHCPAPKLTGEQARIAAVPVAQWVMRVNRRYAIYTAPCLAESLVMVWSLRRRGISANVALGIRTLFGPLESHSWASLDGQPLNDRPEVTRIYEGLDWDARSTGGGMA